MKPMAPCCHCDIPVDEGELELTIDGDMVCPACAKELRDMARDSGSDERAGKQEWSDSR